MMMRFMMIFSQVIASQRSSVAHPKEKRSVFSSSSEASSASSARLKLKAEHQELLTRRAFLKKKQDIELQEARLKVRNEQLELEAKTSASEAKIQMYAEYESGQDDMNSYASTQKV